MRSPIALSAAAVLLASQIVGAFNLNTNDQKSIKDAAKVMAANVWSYYNGNKDPNTLGQLPQPDYYWWISGGFFGNMIYYATMTGDTQYNDDIAKGIYSQLSPTKDFMMTIEATQLGNDDQAFWGLTAMEAAEQNFTVPSGAASDIWLTAASNVWNDLIRNWNTSTCNGGIKWQFNPKNGGFDYKSSVANAAAMQLGARLALHTGNKTYFDKAVMIYDWMSAVGFITDSGQVLDGAGDDPGNCTKISMFEWSYNSGSVIGATAALANYSALAKDNDGQKLWADRSTKVWQHATQNFFKDNVMYEQACETVGKCDIDEKSFKAYFARWTILAGNLVPAMMPDIQKYFQSTAAAVAKSCTADSKSKTSKATDGGCGTNWYDNKYSGDTGAGETMSGMNVVLGLLGAYGEGAFKIAEAGFISESPSQAVDIPQVIITTSSSGASSHAPTVGPPASMTIAPSAAISSAAQAAISAGANADAITIALDAANHGAPAPSSAVAAIQSGAKDSTAKAAISSALAGVYGAPAPPPPASSDTTCTESTATPTPGKMTPVAGGSPPAATSAPIASNSTATKPAATAATAASSSTAASSIPHTAPVYGGSQTLQTAHSTVTSASASRVSGGAFPSGGAYGGIAQMNGTKSAGPPIATGAARKNGGMWVGVVVPIVVAVMA